MVLHGTDLSEILLAIRERLIDKKVFSPDQVYLSMRMNPPVHVVANQYAIILPVIQNAIQAQATGHGRYATGMDARIDVYVRSRLALDQLHKDTQWLTNRTRGALRKVHEVLDALHLYLPMIDKDRAMLEEPMRIVFVGEPKKRYDNPEWGDVLLEFECKYLLGLNIEEEV